jgi:peptide-methionine (R)-S-oxide reductase
MAIGRRVWTPWLAAAFFACARPPEEMPVARPAGGVEEEELMAEGTNARRLTPLQEYVLRRGGTEPPGTGAYLDHWEPGVYRCAACGNVVFRSEDKFESGSGWPSFTRPASAGAVEAQAGAFLHGSEVHCARCGGHLGHVFDDGPPEAGGKRF